MSFRSMGSAEPDAVEISTHDGIDYVIVRQNIEHAVDTNPSDDSYYASYEWDENQFIVPHGIISLEDVSEHPDKYMDYTYPDLSDDVHIQLAELQDALVELASIIAGD